MSCSAAYETAKCKNAERAKRHRADESGRVDYYPRYIQLEQTNRCQARCIMCNHFILGNRGSSDLNPAVIDALKPALPFCEVLMLNGDGEPFLCADIAHHLELYSHYGVRVGTNTNLCYVTEEFWGVLAEHISFLNISCDAADAERFELIRQGLSFDSFVKNLERLSIEAPKMRKHLDCVVMRQNIDQLVDLVDFAANHHMASVRFHRLGVNPCIGNDADADDLFPAYASKMFERAERRARERGIAIEVPAHGFFGDVSRPDLGDVLSWRAELPARRRRGERMCADRSLASDYLSEPIVAAKLTEGAWRCHGGCAWAWERCYVDMQGNVSTCCFNVRKRMGNLMEQTFDEIWNGEPYRELRRMMMNNKLPNWCSSCAWIRTPRF